MLRMVPFIAIAMLVCGCAEAAHDPSPLTAATPAASATTGTLASIDGTEWQFVRVAGEPVPPTVVATLRFRDGHASGKAGCNAYGAKYEVGADGAAQFQQTLSTKMACLQPQGVMQVEHGIFTAFRQTAKVAMRGGKLVLLDAAGKPLASLARTASQQP